MHQDHYSKRGLQVTFNGKTRFVAGPTNDTGFYFLAGTLTVHHKNHPKIYMKK